MGSYHVILDKKDAKKNKIMKLLLLSSDFV